MMNIPQTKSDYFALQGGIDLVTPGIAMKSGKVIDSQNYEPEISGGYRRIDGYERFDGRTSPTSAGYWVMTVTITGTVGIGTTITGVSSSAFGRVLGIFGTTLVLGRVTGTFAVGENLTISSVIVANTTGLAVPNGASSPSSDADYMLLAANDLRNDIQPVPGSGPIRGVAIYNDNVYAFRDNAAGAAGDMYKSTSSGWVKITMGAEIQFTTGVGQINIGDLIVGGTSAAQATVLAVLLRTGTWGGTGVGTLVIAPISGAWQSGEAINVGATIKATSSTLATTITRKAGGRVEVITANFTGSTNTRKMYGTDGVNLCFEFDGTTYVPIRTGMAVDTPLHCVFFKAYLGLSFQGSFQFSAIGTPYSWTAVLGSGEISTGEAITGLLVQGGNQTASALTIFTTGQTYTLYGNSTADFKLAPSIFELGYAAYTMQQVSNNTFGLTVRGIHSLITTLAYGDFDYSSVSHDAQPYIAARRGQETGSVTNKNRDQYRLFFNDGTALVLGLTGDKINGFMPLNYGRVVRCIYSATLSTGIEVTYFGSDDGYIYKDYTGTSFDGQPIEAWIRLPFNHARSPMVRKRYRRAVFEVKSDGFSSVSIGYDLGYGNPDVMAPNMTNSNQVMAGGFWDQFTWEAFTWDGQIVTPINVSLDGTEKNISFLMYSNRAQDKPHTAQGVTVLYTPRKLER